MVGQKIKGLAVVALAALLAWSGIALYQHGRSTERQEWETLHAEAVATAEREAREDERAIYGGYLNALNQRFIEQRDIGRRLESELVELRKRPERATEHLPGTTRPGCEAANGLELAGVYAEFLARYSALSAEYDSELARCYAYADALIRRQ